MTSSPAVGSNPDPATALAYALRGRRLTPFERHLIDVLHADIFKRPEGLTSQQHCALSYRRFRYLRERLDLNVERLFADYERLLALHEWVGLVDGTLTTILTIHYNLCIGSIRALGNGRRELQPFLDELERLDTFGVFLATELGFGNNVQALETQAVYDAHNDEFVIDTPSIRAQKFMPNTGADGVPKLAVVMARLKVAGRDCGVFPFLVRVRTEWTVCDGVRVTALGEKPEYALDNAMTSFRSVRIPKHQWLSGPDSQIDRYGQFTSAITSRARRFFSAMNRVQTGKLCLSVAALTVTRASLQLTARYALQRMTFGPGRSDVPILYYRTYQQALLEGVATGYACSFLVRHALADYTHAGRADSVTTHRLLALTKVFVSSRGQQVIAMCRERVGAQGMFVANRMIGYGIQVNGVVTAEGDNELLLIKTARELLQRMDYAPPASSQTVPYAAPLADASASQLLALFTIQERGQFERLSAALSGSAFAEAWNQHLPEAVALASTHASRIALECFERATASVDDPAARVLLDRLLRLLALRELAGHLAQLLIDGVVTHESAASLQHGRAALAAQLHGDITSLVDAFGIPDTLLCAPIGESYMQSYNQLHTHRMPRLRRPILQPERSGMDYLEP